MSFYRLGQYLRYRWRAKGRHGTHSPFVYRFVEEGLRGPLPDGIPDTLQRRVEHHFNIRNKLVITSPSGAGQYLTRQQDTGAWQPVVQQPDLRIDQLEFIASLSPQELQSLLHRHLPLLHESGICLVHGIHRSPVMTGAWQALRSDQSVTISIDLYRIGLLFFNPSIKEQQHFTIK